MADQMRCQQCQSLGLSTDVLCQRCGGTLSLQETDPVATSASPQRGAGPQPSPQPAAAPVAGATRETGQASGAVPRSGESTRSRSWLILVAIAVVAIAVLVATMLLRPKPALQAGTDGPADRILVTNTTDKALTVSFKRRNADGDWVNVRDTAGEKRTLRVKANDTASLNLRGGTYIAVTTIDGAEVESNELVLAK